MQQHDVKETGTAAEPEDTRTRPTTRTRTRTQTRGAFALLASVQFALILAMSVLNVVLPDIQREFGASGAELALLGASYGMSFSGLLLLGGRLADLYGTRRVFLTGTLVFGASSALAAVSTGLWTLLAARFVQGAGAALAVPAAMALVGVLHTEPAKYARAMAFWGGLAASGGTAGMLLSGIVSSWDSWRWAFLLPVAVAVLALALAPRLVPEGSAPRGGRLDILGAVLVTAGIALLSYGLVEAPGRGWTSPVALGAMGGGVLLLLGFVVTESRVPQPLLPLSFLASPRRAVALLAVFLGATGITTIFFMLALYFQQVRGYSALETSAAFVPFGLTLVVSGMAVGSLVQRFGPRTVLVVGLVVTGLGLATLSTIGTDTPYVGAVLAGLVLFPAGAALVFASSTVAATADVPQEQAGLAGAVVNTALEAGPAVGLAVLVTLAAGHTADLNHSGGPAASAQAAGYGFALGIAAAAFAAAACCAFFLLRSRTETQPTPTNEEHVL
ncbi:MFS transporter [Streptomyces sp. NBC_00847]|uniref:MFS transporter n=1 Tax=unclassified Streptomyces TaxID=2593676 RepID=UPI0022540BA4|nr:MFS transporter [Streptomyces sp. NBC_00847]MCX4878617.1 MFS transporter [Streptomyces sp. NBC_00847]